ncbi:hypothetical protein GCM10011350_10040 [Marinomonas arctica]|nr:hypothetical protein GCM10011350_10040 [Marinomonas arctica]
MKMKIKRQPHARSSSLSVQPVKDNDFRVFFIFGQFGYFNLTERVLHFEIAYSQHRPDTDSFKIFIFRSFLSKHRLSDENPILWS